MGGPGVFAGYFRDPAATAAVLVGTGCAPVIWWNATPTATSKVVDRLKDIYISGGENVAPAEVEAALLAHRRLHRPPSSAWKTSAGAKPVWPFVVIRPGLATDEQELLEHCTAQLRISRFPHGSRWSEPCPARR